VRELAVRVIGSLVEGVRTRAWDAVRIAVGHHRGRVIAGLTALALVGGGVAVATTDVEDGAITAMGLGGTAAESEACPTEVPTIAEATEVADRCDQKVFAVESYTPFEQVAALPDYGRLEWSTRTSATRQDVDGDGAWGEIDTTIESVAGPDGRLEVAAPALRMSFSDGSAAQPLAVIESLEGESLSFDVPFELTAPVVEGDRVTYPGVLGDKDIDLVVTVDSDGTGWREVIRVRTPEAAANPALQGIEFPVEVSEGLELKQSGGGFVATGRRGHGGVPFAHSVAVGRAGVRACARRVADSRRVARYGRFRQRAGRWRAGRRAAG
jgi:hypothetical protein